MYLSDPSPEHGTVLTHLLWPRMDVATRKGGRRRKRVASGVRKGRGLLIFMTI